MQETNQNPEKTHGNAPEWATTEEQKAYWNRKEKQQAINENIAELFEGIQNTIQHLMNATKAIKDICEHQQKEIDDIQQWRYNSETDKPI